MAKSNMNQDILKVLLSEEQIHARIQEMGDELFDRFKDRNPMFVGVLNGCFMFMADLCREVQVPHEVDFMTASSYGSGMSTTRDVKILKDLDEDIRGKDVLIVEDIIDSGRTLAYLIDILHKRNPNSIHLCTLLDKPERRVKKQVKVDYTCFTIPDEFVVGYGLDYDQKYRNLPYIGVVEQEPEQ